MAIKTLLIEYDDTHGDVMLGYPLRAPAVEVVRCRDCEHARHYRPYSWKGKRSTIEEWYCEWHSNPEGASEIEPNGFCSWGERRDT